MVVVGSVFLVVGVVIGLISPVDFDLLPPKSKLKKYYSAPDLRIGERVYR